MTEQTDTITTQPTTKPGIIARITLFIRENKEVERFWKFAVVGAIGFIIDAGSVNGLIALGWLKDFNLKLPLINASLTEVGIVGAIGFTLAVASNFIWNRYWTYPDSRSKSIVSQLASFFGINIIGVLIRIPILEGLSNPFGRLTSSIIPSLPEGTAAWIGINMALALAVIVVMFWNFFVNRYITYNDVD